MDVNAITENRDFEDECEEYEIIDDCDVPHNVETTDKGLDSFHCAPEEGNVTPKFTASHGTYNAPRTNNFQRPMDYDSAIREILQRTGYPHEITPGQHKYGGPPPKHKGPAPGPGHEVYVGKIPTTILEDELILMFEECGPIYEMRLMMNPQTKESKGFCFVTFVDKIGAQKAHEWYNNFEIRPSHNLKVNISIPNTRLYVGNIKKSKSKEDIFEEVSTYVEGLKDVIIYGDADNQQLKNRGFAFLDFYTHKHASEAKKRLSSESFQYMLFNMNCVVEWAEPQDEPTEEIMSKVKVLYVRNLQSDVSQEDVEALFAGYGRLEKVKRIKDFCFVHFAERDHAVKALEALNNKVIKSSTMKVSLARPPIDPKLKEQKKAQHAPQRDFVGMQQGMPGHMAQMWGAPSWGEPGPSQRGTYYYDGYECQVEDYYYDDGSYDYQWACSQPIPVFGGGRGSRGIPRGRPLLNRAPGPRSAQPGKFVGRPTNPSLGAPPKPLMGNAPPKPVMRFKSPLIPGGPGQSLKRMAGEQMFGVDYPSKQAKLHVEQTVKTGSQEPTECFGQANVKKEDAWETLPIAQKPLNQMMMIMDYGEQWF